jgi:hypothetical protein
LFILQLIETDNIYLLREIVAGMSISRLNMRSIMESWRAFLNEEEETPSCPAATQDLELNTKNRDAAIKANHIEYGPLNLSDEKYWERLGEHWDTDAETAKKSKCSNCAAFDISPRMEECMPGPLQDKEGTLGYCHMHHFKCHSARTCYTWAAGGPIKEDQVSISWQSKSSESE